MENTELKEKYCREFGYGYFNKHNENEYTKWLESELLEALKQVKNNGVLDGVIVCEHKQHWRTLQEDGSVKKVCCNCNKGISEL
jgi:hypothetical protein